MPHSISLAASMNLEHSIKEVSHERYPVHLQCLRNIKKIKYPDFQAMTSAMMFALNNPWKPQNKRTATPTWSAVPPLMYLSATGTPVSDIQSKKETDEKYVPMNFSAVDKTILTPQGR